MLARAAYTVLLQPREHLPVPPIECPWLNRDEFAPVMQVLVFGEECEIFGGSLIVLQIVFRHLRWLLLLLLLINIILPLVLIIL